MPMVRPLYQMTPGGIATVMYSDGSRQSFREEDLVGFVGQ